MDWKTVYNAEKEYLSGQKGYVIIQTKYSEVTPEVLEMKNWCIENIQDCWSIGSLSKFNFQITFRVWNKKSIEDFKEKFKQHLY